jgi:hypothetical protein
MESTPPASTDPHPHGAVRTEVVDERIVVMTVDRVEKKNAFTPKITNELSDALTRLDEDDDLFVGALAFCCGPTSSTRPRLTGSGSCKRSSIPASRSSELWRWPGQVHRALTRSRS